MDINKIKSQIIVAPYTREVEQEIEMDLTKNKIQDSFEGSSNDNIVMKTDIIESENLNKTIKGNFNAEGLKADGTYSRITGEYNAMPVDIKMIKKEPYSEKNGVLQEDDRLRYITKGKFADVELDFTITLNYNDKFKNTLYYVEGRLNGVDEKYFITERDVIEENQTKTRKVYLETSDGDETVIVVKESKTKPGTFEFNGEDSETEINAFATQYKEAKFNIEGNCCNSTASLLIALKPFLI